MTKRIKGSELVVGDTMVDRHRTSRVIGLGEYVGKYPEHFDAVATVDTSSIGVLISYDNYYLVFRTKKELEKESKYIDILFDGPPGPEAPRLIDSVDSHGKGICAGEWVRLDTDECEWALRIRPDVFRDRE